MDVSQFDEDINEVTTSNYYRPNSIDQYLVIVNLPEDWEEVHNYIINENEIDGIPNRKIDCINDKNFSLRSSIYMMSHDEAEILKSHSKVENVLLNPEKYPQPSSLFTFKFKKDVAFNKPLITRAGGVESRLHTNSIRSNWSHTFVNGGQKSLPYKGVGIATDTVNDDILFSLTGKGVDAVIIDSGVSVLHPDFIADDGTYRVRDVILDGPYKVDPAAFSGYTETITIDGVNIGTRAQEARARSWWSNTSIRSTEFQSLGTLSITSLYTRIHAHSKNGTNAVSSNHGTCCASQIGGNWHGLAFECNLWNIRIDLGSAGGILDASTALDACTIFHNAKKIAQDVADPTLINNSYGANASTGNSNGTTYTIGYRGNTQTYTGNSSNTVIPANSGSARCIRLYRYKIPSMTVLAGGGGSGLYLADDSTRQATSSSVENAIAAGCIVVASAGNNNQKLSDKNDPDYNNWYGNNSTYINRVFGVQKGFSGDDERLKGSIRVGALDCSVEPTDEKQGATKYSIRKVYYSSNGPMINVWAPADSTMAASYASGEDYAREDDSNYYDTWFGGTSSAGPNACSVIALELQSNRKLNQKDIHNFFANGPGAISMGTTELSDPYPDINDASYFANDADASFDAPITNECYNIRGCGNLRGAPRRVLNNPYASNLQPTFANVSSGENIITDQLFLNLDAANYSSGSTWNDSSGNSLNATLNGPTYNSKFGGYFDFDGTDDNATLPTLNIAGNELSFCVWNFGIQSKNSSIIFLGASDGSRILQVHLPYSGNQIFFDKGSGGGGTSYDRINKIGTVADWEGWHHWAFTANAVTGNMRIYRDGVLWHYGNGKTKTFVNVTGNRRLIGQWHLTGGYHRGYISNMQIYKKQLSQAEVIHNFDAMKGRFENRPLILSGISYSLT